jgi:hypothetical protein
MRKSIILGAITLGALLGAAAYVLHSSPAVTPDTVEPESTVDLSKEQYMRLLNIHSGLTHSYAVVDHIAATRCADTSTYKKHVRLAMPRIQSDDSALDWRLMRRMAVQDQEVFIGRYTAGRLLK